MGKARRGAPPIGPKGAFKTKNDGLSNSEQEKVFYNLKERLRKTVECGKYPYEPVAFFHRDCPRLGMTCKADISKDPGSRLFRCTIRLAFDVDIASEVAPDLKAAKKAAFETALQMFKKTFLRVVDDDDDPHRRFMEVSDKPFTGQDLSVVVAPEKDQMKTNAPIVRQNLKRDQSTMSEAPSGSGSGGGTLEGFFICEMVKLHSGSDDLVVLWESANYNNTVLTYDLKQVTVGGQPKTRCILSLDGETMADVYGENEPVAKKIAAGKVLAILRQKCWTIQRKKKVPPVDPKEKGVPKSELMKGLTDEEKTGKEQEDLATAVEKKLESHLDSESTEDLIFGTDFTKEDQTLISKVCHRLEFKTQSATFLGDSKPYITVSRKISPKDLFSQLQKERGENSKYCLVPPKDLHDPSTSRV